MSTYLYLIMHFILKLQKSLYPAFKVILRHVIRQIFRRQCLWIGPLNLATDGLSLYSNCSMSAGPEHHIHSPVGVIIWPDFHYSAQLYDIT